MLDTGWGAGGLTGYEIYVQMNNGPKEKPLDGAAHVSAEESKREVERAARIKELANKIAAGWQGAAGEAAHGAAQPLVDATLESAKLQMKSEVLLGDQSSAFRAAVGNLRQLDPQPPETNLMDDWTPWDTDTEQKVKKYQRDSRHNIDIYSRYDDQSLANESKFPLEYPPVVDPGGDVAVKPGGSEPGGPGGRPPGGEYPPIGPGHVGGGGGSDSVSGLQQVGQFQSPQGTDKSVADPVVPPGERLPGRVPPVPPGPVPGPGWTPVGPGPFGGRGPWTGGGDGSSRFGGRGGGGAEGGSGRAGQGEGGAGRGGAGGSEGAGRGSGAGVRGGEHGAGGRGGGAGGLGGTGGGRGQGSEDDEHERKSFLQEPDPEAIFGSDEMTAPPVIGE